MSSSEVIQQIATYSTPFLLGLVGYFLNRVLGQFDGLMKESSAAGKAISKIISGMDVLNQRFNRMEKDIEVALVSARQVETLNNRVAVMARDQESIWKRIDKFQDALDRLDRNGEDVGKVIGDLRREIEWMKNRPNNIREV